MTPSSQPSSSQRLTRSARPDDSLIGNEINPVPVHKEILNIDGTIARADIFVAPSSPLGMLFRGSTELYAVCEIKKDGTELIYTRRKFPNTQPEGE